uniref:Leucine rich immune protein (Coil-less) n=1 Tax=Anopheles epiroticus TaxID=199890 RepID=A0A182PN35_9DIPT
MGGTLIVSNSVHCIVGLEFYCFRECCVDNLKSQDDAFTFNHIPNDMRVLRLTKVLIKHIDQPILEKIPPFIHTLKIENSQRLKRVSVPTGLSALKITRTGLRRVDIAANSFLSSLEIYKCDLMKVPQVILNAQMIQHLDISSCKLRALNMAQFCDNSHLESLVFDNNNIRFLVDTSNKRCSLYDSLKLLVLSSNKLTTINMELFNVFIKLNRLQLHINRITSISGRLNHSNLTILSIGENQLQHVDLCDWNVPAMEVVTFTLNYLTMVPKCIGNWTSVKELRLSHNKFTRNA